MSSGRPIYAMTVALFRCARQPGVGVASEAERQVEGSGTALSTSRFRCRAWVSNGQVGNVDRSAAGRKDVAPVSSERRDVGDMQRSS